MSSLDRPAAASTALSRVARESGVASDELGELADYAASPDLAIARLLDLDAGAAGLAELDRDERIALLTILGGSRHLSQVLRLEPSEWDDLRPAMAPVAPPLPALDVDDLIARADEDAGAASAGLRRWRQRAFLRIGARDLWGVATLDETVASITRVAETAIAAAARIARHQLDQEYGALELAPGESNRFAVLGMGKLGGAELNYSSDVDLVFLHEAEGPESRGGRRGSLAPLAYFTRLAERMVKLLSEVTGEGFVFRVDLRLRPDGNNGPLTSSLAATLGYYEAFGRTWERAALFKARPVGGDLELGKQALAELAPFIYRRTLDFTMISDLEQMKARIDQEVSLAVRDRHVKLGPGGIRELEFLIQSFAMVHGGRDRQLRERNTLGLLGQLVEAGHLPEADGAALAAAYRWLRRVEHALQIDEDRQLHRLPDAEEDLRTVARRLGLHREGAGPIWTRRVESDALARFRAEHARHTGLVHAAFAELFRGRRQRTMEIADATARLLVEDPDGPDAFARLAEIGFADPERASDDLRRIRDGSSHRRQSAEGRRRVIDLAPALLGAARHSPDPDRALGRLADFLDRVGARQTFVALLAENHATLGLLLNLFASSEYLTSELLAHPELLDTLVRSDLATVSKSQSEFERELSAQLASAEDLEQGLDVLRRYRHEEFLRIGLHDVQGAVHHAEVSEQLSALAEALLVAARAIALDERRALYGAPAGLDLAVVAMGKLGGRELNYHSDLDLIFVYGPSGSEGDPGAGCRIGPHEFFAKVAQLLLSNLQIATREGYVYKIDTRLRPSGNAGALVTSLDGFARYHESSSAVWERQALIRARPVAGSPSLRAAVARVIEGFVYGRSLAADERAEIARLRGRMERELSREDAKHFNLKTGRGGLVDVEFIAQVLVLTHGERHPSVRKRATLDALDALGAEGLLSADDHRLLTSALAFFRGLENRLRIEGDSPVERVRRDPRALARAARRMGFADADVLAGARLLAEWQRHREAVRAAFERLVAPIPDG